MEQAIELDRNRFHEMTPVLGYRIEKLAECCLNLGDRDAAAEALTNLESCWAHLPPRFAYQHQSLARLRERLIKDKEFHK